ncbi:MAG: hypothetical protein IJO43_01360 [Bacilli bacterium]|nr:hypothetical protein [Bacilli bacterium]
MKLNKKMIIMLASVVGVLVVLVIILMLFVGGGSKKLSFEKIEEKLLSAGESYYEDNKDKLPDSGSSFVTSDELVEEDYIKELSSYTEEDVTCDGKVYATKNPSGYSYHAVLDCGKDYSTKSLKDKLIKNVVTSGSGLYKEEQVNPNNNTEMHTVYVFKGDNVKNYIKVGDYYWEIVKVYENGEIAVLGDPELLRDVWDDRYNLEIEKYDGINDYNVSRMHDTIIKDVVNDKEGYLKIKSLITTHTACVGKRNTDDVTKDGSTECSETLENQYFSLLPAYDYINASLDSNCNTALDYSCYNYNYLSGAPDEWWTVTGVGENNYDVYFIDVTMEYEAAKSTMAVRLYAHLNSNTTYVSGSGTYEDPYIVK